MGAGGSATLIDAALLALLAAAYLWFIRSGARGIAAPDRIARYRRWMAYAPAAFGGSALLVLLMAADLAALVTLPVEFVPLVDDARRIAGLGNNVARIQIAVVAAVVGSALVGLAVAAWLRRRGRQDLTPRAIAVLLPRGLSEIGWAASLAAVAAIVEELYFRLALPLVVARLTGSALAAMLIATLMFARAHRGYGWPGMAFGAFSGATLALLYLATGELWFAMLAHALLNLNGLVLRPLVLPVSSSAASQS
jgi:membrane protease YdiL (CAAX protease family)